MPPVAPSSAANGGSSSNAPWIPLRDDYFETPLLSQKESTYLVRKSCEAAQEVVERARSSGGPIQWRHVEKYHDVQLYAGFSRGTYSQEPTSMCGVTSVPGSIKEIASLFDLPTTRAMKEFSRAHRDLFFDSVVLYTLSPRTREKPLHQVTAKWIATKCPKGMDDRDYCYLECQDKFMDSTGRKGWVLCLHSIKLPGCDELSREFGFVRGSFYHSGIVVVEADRPGFVDIIHMLQINLKNNTKMPQAYLRERVAWISRLKGILRYKRLNEQRYLSDLELVPKKYRSRCHVCHDSFSLLLLRKMNCRKCGEVVCGACSKDFDVTNAKFLETIKLRICMHCYQMISVGQMSNVMDQPRASTSLSLLGFHEDNHRASVITEALPGLSAPHNNHREGPTKIFLQSMRHHPQHHHQQHHQQQQQRGERRSSRHSRETEPGRRMPQSTDPRDARGGRRSAREVPGAPPPASAPSGFAHERGYSLFDAPRGGGNGYGLLANTPPPPSLPAQNLEPSVPLPPASLFDRHSTRTKKNGNVDPRRSEKTRNSTSTTQSALPTTSPQRKPRSSTRDSRGTFKIPHSLYDYSALDPEAAKRQPPPSPVQRSRGGSTSSVSSTGSVDVDSYQVKKAHAANGKKAAPGAVPKTTASVDRDAHDGEDTEGSIGSGDDEPVFFSREKTSSEIPLASSSSFFDERDNEEEETKSHEFETTPALPPPSPSAFAAAHDALRLSSHTDTGTMDVPFQRRNFNISDLSSVYTTDCDTGRYLDSEMRQFHGQPFYMRDASGADGDEPRPTIDVARANGSFMHAGTLVPENNSILQDASDARGSGSALAPPPLEITAKTSPLMSAGIMPRPPLYGRPKKKTPAGEPSSRAAAAPSSFSAVALRNDSILSTEMQPFELHNGTMISTVPSGHSNEDLTFKDHEADDDKNHRVAVPATNGRTGESTTAVSPAPDSAAGRASPPSPPSAPSSYIPSRFQTRQSDTNVKESPHVESTTLDTKSSSSVSKATDDKEMATAFAARVSVKKQHQPSNQDEIEDVDFEELLRMSVSNQDDTDKDSKKNGPVGLSRSHTFDLANALNGGHYGDLDDSSDSDSSSERDLLSARRMYLKFNSSKRLAKVAGVNKNPTFQRTFAEIQEGINMLSDSGEDSDSESTGWSEDVAAMQRQYSRK